MKRIACQLLAFTICLLVVTANAESGFLPLAEEYLRQIADFTDKDTAVLSASGYDPDKCIISFDFTDGNQTIVAIDGNQCEVFYFFDDDELMSVLFQMITKFDEVKARIPVGKELEFEMKFSETEINYITSDTIGKHYSWIQ